MGVKTAKSHLNIPQILIQNFKKTYRFWFFQQFLSSQSACLSDLDINSSVLLCLLELRLILFTYLFVSRVGLNFLCLTNQTRICTLFIWFCFFTVTAGSVAGAHDSSSMSSGNSSFQQTDSRLTSLTASPLLSQAQSPCVMVRAPGISPKKLSPVLNREGKYCNFILVFLDGVNNKQG